MKVLCQSNELLLLLFLHSLDSCKIIEYEKI